MFGFVTADIEELTEEQQIRYKPYTADSAGGSGCNAPIAPGWL